MATSKIDPAAVLHERLAAALGTLDPEAKDADPVVRPSDRADFQANGALALAKRLGRNPRELAQAWLDAADVAGVATAEVAGPGFLNLTLDDAFVADRVAAMAADDRLGVAVASTPETVVVDYSAPNVAKEMHVGHLRSTVIGDAIVRLLGHVGHRVVRENHTGDWGTPFGMLIEHLLDVGDDVAADQLSLGDLESFYREARIKFDTEPGFADRSRGRVVMLQRGDPETLRMWRVLVDQSTRYFDVVYEKLGVLLSRDDLRPESGYNDELSSVVHELEAKGLLVESDGARCVFPPGFTNREGEPLPIIVQNRAGGFNYNATDLATIRDRTQRTGATWLVYVVGAPQALHLQMVFAVAEMAGWLMPPARAVHVGFGNVLGPDGKMFKTRSGENVKLIELLDEAVARAAAAVAEKNPDLDAATAAAVARAVGIGAVKHSDLANDRIKDYVFDWDRMLAFEGNTAPYLQYAHARIQSIFRRGDVDPASVRGVVPTLAEPAERQLALRLLRFGSGVHDSIDKLAPHRLSTELFELAGAFTTFYEACPVLRADDEATRTSRLALCDLTARVLATGLGLLGIEAPNRM